MPGKSTTQEDSKLREKIAKLREDIRQHEYRYYSLDQPTISDAEFDRRMNQLKQLEAEHPELITPDSPTQRVGGTPRKGFETRQHRPPMLSLDNAFSYEELDNFDRRVHELTGRQRLDYIAEHKFDGLSISLVYEGGGYCAASRAAMAQPEKTSPPMCASIRSIPLQVDFGGVQAARPQRRFRSARRNHHAAKGLRGVESPAGRAGRQALRQSAQRGCRSGARALDPRSPRHADSISSDITSWPAAAIHFRAIPSRLRQFPACASRPRKTGNFAAPSRT